VAEMTSLAALTNSASAEHYTSPLIVERARKVLGEIDLDPASSLEANRVVRAKMIFTREDDGRVLKWGGEDAAPSRVFINPPSSPRTNAVEYARTGDVRAWWVKAMGELQARRVRAFVFIVFRIDALTSMAAGSLERGLPLPLSGMTCWPHKRVPYWKPGAQLQFDGTPSQDVQESPTHATCILLHTRGLRPPNDTYFDRFAAAFRDIGTLTVPWVQ